MWESAVISYRFIQRRWTTLYKSNFYGTDLSFETLWGLKAISFLKDNRIKNEGWKPLCHWMNEEDEIQRETPENCARECSKEHIYPTTDPRNNINTRFKPLELWNALHSGEVLLNIMYACYDTNALMSWYMWRNRKYNDDSYLRGFHWDL